LSYSQWLDKGSDDLRHAHVSVCARGDTHDVVPMPLVKVVDAVKKGVIVLPGDRPVVDLRDEQEGIVALYNAGYKEAEYLNELMIKNILEARHINAKPEEVEAAWTQPKGNAKTYFYTEIIHNGVTHKLPDGFVYRNPKAEGKRRASDRKKKLPGVTYAGAFHPQRKGSDLVRATGLYGLDLDGPDDPDALSAKIRTDPNVFLESLSITGSGFAVVVRGRVALTPTEYSTTYKAIAAAKAKEWGVGIDVTDPATSDICRLRFLSCDDGLYVNWDAIPFVIDVPDPAAPTSPDAPKAGPGAGARPGRRMCNPSAQEARNAPNGEHAPISAELMRELLGFIPADNRPTWVSVCGGIKLWGEEIGQPDEAFEIGDTWSQKSSLYDAEGQRKNWDTLNRGNGETVATVGTIIFLAKKHGWKPQRRMASLPPAADDGQDEPEPPIVSAKDLLENDDITEPPQLVQGLLHRGSRLVLGGHSKAYKSLIMIDLGLSIAAGKPFMGFPCKQGRVLIVNLELPDWSMKKRIAAVAKAKGITDVGGLDVMNMRGWPGIRALGAVSKKLCEAAEAGIHYDAILLDPVYRLLGGGDESNPGDVAMVLCDLAALTDGTGASLIYAAHYSKGNQAAKEAIDRISGSGIWMRDADAAILFTKHKAETRNAYTVDLILRDLPPLPAFVVECKYPLMQRADDLNPNDIKRPGRPKERCASDLLKLLPTTGLKTGAWKGAAERAEIPEREYYRLRKQLVEQNLVEERTKTWFPL
jgi:hypothetical protein